MSFLSRLRHKAPASERVSVQSPDKTTAPPSTPATEHDAEAAALPFGSRLLELAFDETHPAHRAAQKRLVELVDAGAISIEQLPWDSARRLAVLAIAAATADAAHFERIASRIEDGALWKELATGGSTAKLRQLAAARVETPDELRAVMKAARERDKNVYRIAKTKLDAIHAAEKRTEERWAHMHSIAETIERHVYKPFDNAYVASIDHLEREWRAVDVEIPQELKTRVEAAIDRAREFIAERVRAAGQQAAHDAAVANASPLRAAALDELRKMLAALYAAEDFDANAHAGILERLARLNERWRDTVQYKAATDEETKTFAALRRAVERTAQAMLDTGTLRHGMDAARSDPSEAAVERLSDLIAARALLGETAPPLVAEAESLTREWREKRALALASAAEIERHLGQLIRKAQHALNAGRSRQAFGMRRSIEAKLSRLPRVPKLVTERLQQLDAKLQEIQDWRSFAVTPKRSELIAAMQALIGVERPPAELAEDIKRLQEEWKTLAKGSTDSDGDWAKFHEAAQAAYAPCKAYFEAQAQQRELHLERRKALLARLERYESTTDWEQVEWKNVVDMLRLAKQEWRNCGPSERAATRPIERRFDALLARIQDRLDREYTANIEGKQTLVKQAERLAALTDLAQAANEVKRLQSAWRNIGVTPHAQGQRLWDEFKAHCDAVFDRRRKEHAERLAELDQHEERALALCIEVESSAQRAGEALYAAAARVRELRAEFVQLGELPRDKAHEIQRRFRRAVDEFEHAIARERQREADRAWDNYFDAVSRIGLCQLAAANAQEGVDDTALRRHIDSIDHWPKAGKRAIEQRLAAQPQLDIAENEARLRTLVIRAEIATGTATPDAEQAQRRTMQLQALVKGIGRDSATPRDQLEALALEWAAIGPVSSQAYEALLARFKRCWAIGHGGRG